MTNHGEWDYKYNPDWQVPYSYFNGKNMNVDNLLIVLNSAIDDRKKYFSTYDIKSIIKHSIDYIIPSSLYIKNFDMYVMEGKLINYFSKLKVVKKEVEKLALRLMEDSKKGAKDDEKK